jgi:DNA-binding transcriptional MerR regulator
MGELTLDSEIYGMKDAARALDLTPDGVRYLVNRGRLREMRTPSGQRLFLREDIERLAAERTAERDSTSRRRHIA